MIQKLLLWVAQGFGLGRIPIAPGTFGSVLGLCWFGVLLSTCRLWSLGAGIVAGTAVAIWLCGLGERVLGEKDPPSVVLDEVVAMPWCFCFWTAIWFQRQHSLPGWHELLARNNWPAILAVFGAFRLFDVWKPWPVRQSQRLPSGWGIVVDDLLAAVYVNVAGLAAWWAKLV
jgi:phosphatidylglycerophosphatase A